MKQKTKRLIIILLFSLNIFAATEKVDWWKARKDVSAKLSNEKISVINLATNICNIKPQNAQDAIFNLCVFMRMGMTKEAVKMLRFVKNSNAKINEDQISSIYYAVCGDFKNYDVAKAIVEIFADKITELELNNCLLKNLLQSGQSVEEIDKWLSNMPEGKNNFWIKQRAQFNIHYGSRVLFIKKITEEIQKNPQNIQKVLLYLESMNYARQHGTININFAWMANTVKPKTAVQARNIANLLKRIKDYKTAIKFYRIAVTTPLIDDEVAKLYAPYQVPISIEKIKALFIVRTKEDMAECFLKLGKNDEAQKQIEEATNIRKKFNLRMNSILAGRVQKESGKHTIENEIIKEEKISDKNPEYWEKRAFYYKGRNNPEKEEKALIKGLALTKPTAPPNRPSKRYIDWRSRMLRYYALFLKQEDRSKDAVKLLRKEIEQVPADSESSRRAASLLAYKFPEYINPEEPVLWNWLSKQQKWSYPEERLLMEMLERTNKEKLNLNFARAEKLTSGKDPSRAYILGWVMNRMKFATRSIPLLEYGYKNADNDELKRKAAFALFESYIDTDNWKMAENISSEVFKHLTSEKSRWHSRIAVVAAKTGDKNNAMRIWKDIANLYPYQIDSVKELANLGLKEDLIKFYKEMQKNIPSSNIPVKALKILE